VDFLSSLTLYDCVNKVYISVVLYIKKELLVLEYKDRSYVVTRCLRFVDMSLSCRCRVSN
jgi:uncharacterized membrane protein